MKKIIFSLGIAILAIFSPSLSAIENTDLIDLHLILKQIDSLNQVIATYKKDSQKAEETSLYVDQKNNLLKEFASKIIDPKEKIGFDIEKIHSLQEEAKAKLEESYRTKNAYLSILETTNINSLWLDERMYDLMENLRQKIDFFSQKEDVVKIISPYLLQFTQKSLQKQALPNTLKEDERNLLKDNLKTYELKLQSYIETLSYIQKNPQDVLPKSIAMSSAMEWVLEKIDHFIPLNTNNLGVAKVILSLITLVFLLGCRKIVARIFIKIADFFIKFTRHNEEIQNKIRNDIIAPISAFLLVWSFDISIDILYYPNFVSPKVQIWFSVAYVVLVAWFVISLLKGYGTAFITSIAQKSSDGFRKEVISLILKILYFIVIILAILVILKILGFNISAIIASLGIGGLAVALAVKDVLANFFASVMLLFDNSFSQGDWIVCGEIEGTVVEMGLRRTTIRTFDNALLFVPNSELANKSICNWNRRKVGRRIKMSVGLTYDSPKESLQNCVQQIREMLLNNPNISKDSDERGVVDYQVVFKKDIISMDDYMGYKSTLFVYLDEFADSSINILIYCFTKTVSWGEFLKVKEDVLYEIMKIVQANHLSFAFPSQSVYVESFPKPLEERLKDTKIK